MEKRRQIRDIYYQVAASPMAYRYIGPYGQELYTNNIQYFAYHNDGDKHVTVGSLQPEENIFLERYEFGLTTLLVMSKIL